MEKIQFDNLNNNKVLITLIILSLLLIFIAIFDIIPFKNPKINDWISGIGFLLQGLFFSRILWFKNYVQWNKKGATIKIKSFFGKSLNFDQIKMTELNDKKLIITKKNGNKVTFDLNKIAQSDIQKLNELIIKNTVANNGYESWWENG